MFLIIFLYIFAHRTFRNRSIMKNKTNIILTFQDYFDVIDFDTLELKEKIAYVLFYVTQIAALRKDMTPNVISNRINDQIRLYHQRFPSDEGEEIILTTVEEVSKVISEDSSFFIISSVGDHRGRNKNELAYVLTKNKNNELWKEFNTNIKDVLNRCKKKSIFEKAWVTLFVFGFLLLGAYIYISYEYNNNKINIQNLSQPDFLEAVDFQHCSDGEKGIFFTYYITQLTQLREDITPYVICERIAALKYKMPSVDKMTQYFEDSELVMRSQQRDSAFIMTKQGVKKVEKRIISNSQKDTITIMWILNNVSAQTVIGLLSIIVGIITFTFILGFRASSLIKE